MLAIGMLLYVRDVVTCKTFEHEDQGLRVIGWQAGGVSKTIKLERERQRRGNERSGWAIGLAERQI